ncbi:MAG: hypothetical protein GY808_18965, partial [Gammaproteobacteria bacterium]|nr:hypothetical protein [Gammaproteobacteria bacterium]
GSATPDALGESTILVTGLASGAHIVYFAAQRDDGEVDKTPVAVSFTARVGEFTPTIVNDSPVTPGGGWFAGVELPFSWSVVLGYYYGSLPATPFSFAYNDSTNFDNSADPMPGGWVADITTSITPEAGFHDFFLKVRDAAGAISLFRIDFEAADPTFDEGILVVNGVHAPTYGDQIVSKIDSGAYWGDDLDVTFWDIFGDDTSPSAEFTLPGNASYEGGGGAVGPGVLARFSTVVWLGNGYQGDDEAYNSSPILPYLTAGGNLIFASRNANAGGFIPDGGLTDWLNIGWRGLGENALEYEPCFPGLVSMEPFRRGMSATDVFSGGGFMSSSGDHTLITNWDGVSSFTKSDMTSTMIFVHRNGDFNEDYGGNFETYCRGLGVWAHPNFPFSSQTAGDEFPTAGTIEAQGNYIYLAGRHYGFDDAACMANFNFMLKNMCAEQ